MPQEKKPEEIVRLKFADLYKYQRKGTEFLTATKRRGMFWDMRAGKSVVSVVSARLLKCKRVLIVCEASNRLQWGKEWRIWGDLRVEPQIVSYNFIQQEENIWKLGEEKWDLVIFDEVQNITKWSAIQSRHAVQLIAPRAKRLWLLSGTPATNSAADYHIILSLLEPGKWGKFIDFCNRYCEVKEQGFGKYKREVHTGFKRSNELREALLRNCSRVKLEEVEKDLPEMRFSELAVEVLLDLPEPKYTDDQLNKEKVQESLIPYFKQLGFMKAIACRDFILSLREPVIIWCWYHETMSYLFNSILLCKKAAIFSGKQTAVQKEKIREGFNAGDLDYVVCQYQAGAKGQDFSGGSVMVCLEYPWSAAIYKQAIARTTKVGKKKGTHVYNVVSEIALDKRILASIKKKAQGLTETIG